MHQLLIATPPPQAHHAPFYVLLYHQLDVLQSRPVPLFIRLHSLSRSLSSWHPLAAVDAVARPACGPQIADLVITAVNGSRTLDEGSELPDDVLNKFSAWGWLVLNVCEARALPEGAGAL